MHQILEDPDLAKTLWNVLGDTPIQDTGIAHLKALIIRRPPPSLSGKWDQFALRIEDPENPMKEYMCVFDSSKCDYSGRKPLVRRHILYKHFGIK